MEDKKVTLAQKEGYVERHCKAINDYAWDSNYSWHCDDYIGDKGQLTPSQKTKYNKAELKDETIISIMKTFITNANKSYCEDTHQVFMDIFDFIVECFGNRYNSRLSYELKHKIGYKIAVEAAYDFLYKE